MKISNASISFLANRYLEQKQATLSEQTFKTKTNHTFLSQDAGDFSDQVRDRVSISKTEKQTFQSNYASHTSGRTVVRTGDYEKPTVNNWQSSVEKMVGGIVNKEVVLQNFTEDKGPQTEKLSNKALADKMRGSGVGGQVVEMTLKNTDVRFEDEQLIFNSQGEVVTEDGRTINFTYDMEIARTFFSKKEEQTLVRSWQERVPLHDPLVISLDGNAPQLTDTAFEFDLFDDGFNRYISFVAPGSGFLAFDKNNDNVINDGSELFGPMTGNGFSELSVHDDDANNWIDENDAVFDQLSVWTRDENGEDKLISLKEAGVGAIYLDHQASQFSMTTDENELKGQLRSTGMYLRETGDVGTVHQVDLAFRTSPNRIRDTVPPHARLQVVDLSKIDPEKDLLTEGTIIKLPD